MRPFSCDTARARISLRLDGELSRFEAALLERHLHGCSACAAFAEDAGETTSLLRGAVLETAPHVWMPRRVAATRLAARVAAVTAAAAAAAIVAVSYASVNRSTAQESVGFGLWPRGLAVHPRGDGNLGVRHVAFETPAPGSERALLSA